ncbi:MAG: HD domain-containing protein [Bacilli bacterium]|nr:HD domain-containing protein [Bacilli bacterium]MDD4644051.1 HD domain-containing protein [Bacilli bacterium]
MDLLEEVKSIVQKELISINSCHEWEHTERVFNLALSIGEKEGADLEILSLAAILHDIGRKDDDGIIDHAERGAILAKEILERYNYPSEKIEKICHCIKAHRYRNENVPETLEAKVLYDADKLDAIGAIGIGRAFSYAGHIGAKVHNKEVDVVKTEEFSSDDTAWREYEVKLKYIKDKLFTKEGRRIAEGRHAFMEQFFERLNKEVDGKE